jgi:hypothetical protein
MAIVIINMLQMTLMKKMNMTNIILNKLKSRSIIIMNSYETRSKKAYINEIIKELKTKVKHYNVFNRALNANEDIVKVDFAI